MGGVSSARNFGIDNASGEYLMFVDVDDYLLPDTLNDAMTVVEENPDADFFIFGYNRISKEGKNTHQRLCQRKYYSEEVLNYINNTDALTLGAPWAKIFKKEFIDSNNFNFDISRKLFEDICFNLWLLNKTSCFVTSDIEIYCYEVNNQSATARFNGETFIEDVTYYLNTFKTIIPEISKKNNEKEIASEIILSTEKTACFNTLYEIYNLYRQHRDKTLDKYNWMNRLIEFMGKIKSDWKTIFSSGFPRIFVISYNIHPKCAHIILNLVFRLKR